MNTQQAKEDIDRLTRKVEAFERAADEQIFIINRYCNFLHPQATVCTGKGGTLPLACGLTFRGK